MSVTLVKPNQLDLLSLDDVKRHLRIEHPHEDEYIKTLIYSATDLVEKYIGRSLLIKTWCLTWHTKGRKGVEEIPLPNPPLVDIEKVDVVSKDHVRLPVRRYGLDTSGQIPILSCLVREAIVEVFYQSGYSETPRHVPAAIRQAALLAVGDLYENRINCKIQAHSLFQLLLQPYVVRSLGVDS